MTCFPSSRNDVTYEARPHWGKMMFGGKETYFVEAVGFEEGYAIAEPRDDFDTAILYEDALWEALGDWEERIMAGQSPKAGHLSQIEKIWSAIATEYERERKALHRKQQASKDIDPAAIDWLIFED